MLDGWYIVNPDMSLRETVVYKTHNAAQHKVNRNKTMANCVVMHSENYMNIVRQKEYPLEAKVWWRESTQEWVLEISGVINGVNLTFRHTQSKDCRPDEVPGLPEIYQDLEDSLGRSLYMQAWEV